MKTIRLLVVGLIALAVSTACSTQPKITQGSVVKIEYKGTLSDGTVFDTTEGKQPLSFLVGANQVIPAFETNVISMKAGQTKKFTIKAKEAYGDPDPSKIVTLPKDQRFTGIDLKEGATIFANNKAPDGRVIQTPMKVVKVTDSEVTMDYNHPLAGKDLTFEVKVVEVQQPQAGQPTGQAQPQAQPQPQQQATAAPEATAQPQAQATAQPATAKPEAAQKQG
jgi:FKBP-type peptidyl-prolyl cis-trans isomerase 2